MADDSAPATDDGGEDQDSRQTSAPKDDQNSVAYWRRQATKHEKDLGALKKSQMSETERLRQERDDATKKVETVTARSQTILIQSKLEAAAARSGCHDADAAARLADLSGVTVDEDGRVSGIDKALDALKKSKPYLFAKPAPGVGNGGGNTRPPATDSKKQIANGMDAAIRGRAGY